MWDTEIVKARFVEAADTEKFLPRDRVGTASGFWPQFLHDAEDRKGWDDQARLDNATTWRGRASAGALTRHQECLDWTIAHLKDEKRRHIIWAWAFCKATGRDFGAHCKKRGWVRQTAYRRLNDAIERITRQLSNSNCLLLMPHENYMRLFAQRPLESMQREETSVAPPMTTPAAFISEKSTDLLKTPEAVLAFVEHLESVNASRREMLYRRFGVYSHQHEACGNA